MSLMMALMCVFTLSFSSCGSDDDDDKLPAPEITINEANIEGDELCTQADVVAKGRTASILMVIESKDGVVKMTRPVTDSKYIGVLNIDGFHVHADIAGKNVVEGDVLNIYAMIFQTYTISYFGASTGVSMGMHTVFAPLKLLLSPYWT